MRPWNLKTALILASLLLGPWPDFAGVAQLDSLILQAGNANDDADRLTCLRQMQALPDLAPPLRADLDRMTQLVDRWIHHPQLFQWFHRQIRDSLDYNFGVADTSPFYPLTHLYRARMLIWTANEYGNIIGYHDERRRFFDRALAELQSAHKAFPENRIVRMYLGEPIPPAKQYTAPDTAPPWAVAQREGLERLTDLILWWIEHRLQKDGQYGGGWDDDCEMWRNWVPAMIAFEHPRITQAQAFFSRQLLSQDYMKDGYTSRIYDVEHTAEPSSDTITPMMHLAPDDPQWSQRARRIADLMKTVWTDQNERGQLQFVSTYFSATRNDPNPLRGCDTPYHVRAVEPALILWLRTADPQLTHLFADWMDTWVHATTAEERGKPAGILPAAIRWPTGEPAGPGPDWWDPRHHGEPRLYEWPSAMAKMTDMLLLTYHMTGNKKYLEPLVSMAEIRREWLQNPSQTNPPQGSRLWCGSKMSFLANTLVKYKLLTGHTQFDDLILHDYGSTSSSHIDPHNPNLVKELQQTAQALAINFPGRTSEVRWTDRVFAFARLFGDDMLHPDPIPTCNQRPTLKLLYGSATGDRGHFEVFPLNAVRWLTPPRDIAAVVTDRGSDHFSAQLFHFGDKPRPMAAQLYLLTPGDYLFELSPVGEARPAPAAFRVKGPQTQIQFTLPQQTTCLLRVARADAPQLNSLPSKN